MIKIEVLEKGEAEEFLQQNHYLGPAQGGSIYLGIYEDEILNGLASFIRSKQQEKMFGVDMVLELNRFVLLNNEKNQASKYLATVLKLVCADVVVTFADENQGHFGVIYQACNAFYLGKSKGSAGLKIDDKVYSGRNLGYTLSRLIGKIAEVVSLLGKHKYVFVTSKGENKDVLIDKFKKLSLPYPKIA